MVITKADVANEDTELAPEEHDEEYRPTGVEREETSEPNPKRSPYDPNLIRVDPKTFSLRSIIEFLDTGDLDLAPDFQRNRVWKPWQKSRLIESILLRIPLPAFYFAAEPDGILRVVDGLQRLSTVRDFIRDGFALRDLEYLDEKQLGGLTFSKLQGVWSKRIYQTQIFVHVIDPQTPARVKFDIFRRINTGGSPLTTQEIRHCMSKPRSRQFLKDCTESPAFRRATQDALYQHIRMADREAVLRFCSFRMLGPNIQSYDATSELDEFLTDWTQKFDSPSKVSDWQMANLRSDLDRSMENAYRLFGAHAFRKWPLGMDRLNPINRPLLESWGCALADYEWKTIAPQKEAILLHVRAAMKNDPEYRDAISASTANYKKVWLRFNLAREILAQEVRKP